MELKNQVVLGLSQFPGVVEKHFSPRVNRWVNFVNWSRRIPTKHYYNCTGLPEKAGEKYDFLFAGSDQIWNYSFSSERFHDYFLQFSEYDKRASLSASFGVESIPDEWKQRYADGLSGMKYISVRETAGAKLVKDLTGRKVPVLVDPVMMLDRVEWLATAKQPPVDCSVPYVLKYYLGDEDDKKIDRWAERNGYRVYELMKEDKPELYSTGPGEFLSLIDHAALVCSDSFHCIAFSILFKKPFIVYARKGKLNNMGSRMETLMEKFGLSGRWDDALFESDYLNCDFQQFDVLLENERKLFRDYVDQVIGERKDQIQLADKSLCTGCSACASSCPMHCIEMLPDQYGFRYPLINSNACMHCGACTRSCPIINKREKGQNLPDAFAAYSLDEHLRAGSSSGAIFSEIAKLTLDEGGAVFGAAYDKNFDVHHVAVEDLEKLKSLRGAKYAESKLDDTFSQVRKRLESGQAVLFSGTPCQVSGLKAFLGKEYDQLICIDFVCHSVPSPLAWRKYVEYRANCDDNGKLPTVINLRDKSSGWSRYRYSNSFTYADGRQNKILSTDSAYMSLFTNDCISRLSCSNCQFKGYERSSDITLGDFWGIWDICPEMDDDKGTSLVLLQSNKGREIWDQIKHRIKSEAVSLEQASQMNLSIISASKANDMRNQALDEIRTHGFEAGINTIRKRSQSFFSRLKRKIERSERQLRVHFR